MPAIRKILCPICLDDDNVLLADYVQTQAELTGATVILTYIVDTPKGLYITPTAVEPLVQLAKSRAETDLSAFAKAHFKDINVEIKVLVGSPAQEILSFARKQKIDMIIMGTHGRENLERILVGSVAEKVLRNAECPVMTVRPYAKQED